jgi:hypothetical protein
MRATSEARAEQSDQVKHPTDMRVCV